jgi:hypothetical protein
LASASAVTVQVFTTWRSTLVAPGSIRTPRSRSSRPIASTSDRLTLQPRFVMAADVTVPGTSTAVVGTRTEVGDDTAGL